MSDINTLKNRLQDMILKYKTNVNETTLKMFVADMRNLADKYFALTDFSVVIQPTCGNEVDITVKVVGRPSDFGAS